LKIPLRPRQVTATLTVAALACRKIFGIKPDKTDILRHSPNPYLH
jgi:hypothetical protein